MQAGYSSHSMVTTDEGQVLFGFLMHFIELPPDFTVNLILNI